MFVSNDTDLQIAQRQRFNCPTPSAHRKVSYPPLEFSQGVKIKAPLPKMNRNRTSKAGAQPEATALARQNPPHRHTGRHGAAFWPWCSVRILSFFPLYKLPTARSPSTATGWSKEPECCPLISHPKKGSTRPPRVGKPVGSIYHSFRSQSAQSATCKPCGRPRGRCGWTALWSGD